MAGTSIFDISVDHELWRLAQKLNELSDMMTEIEQDICAMNTALKDHKEMYQGRGRAELDSFIDKYTANIGLLALYYGYCSTYVNDALSEMLEFDEALKKKFEEGVIEYIGKNPEDAKKLFGG